MVFMGVCRKSATTNYGVTQCHVRVVKHRLIANAPTANLSPADPALGLKMSPTDLHSADMQLQRRAFVQYICSKPLEYGDFFSFLVATELEIQLIDYCGVERFSHIQHEQNVPGREIQDHRWPLVER